MGINFCDDRWNKVLDTYTRWWNGELDRPILAAITRSKEPERKAPSLPSYTFTACYDLSVPAEQIVDRWDYDLSCCEYAGDAFPSVWPNFGPGVAAAFLGAQLQASQDTVWFHSPRKYDIADLHLEYDPNNVWLNRIKDIYRAAIDRWQGRVQLGMTDLGGTLDILSSFLPGEQLLMELYDNPEQVGRLTWEIHELWHRYFHEFNSILQPVNPGYSSWCGILSPVPYYILQSDFSYMISPDMFDEFVKPELQASCKRLARSFYHLDGSGELPHLDSLLQIEELDGVQWVPGAGQSQQAKDWMDVYMKIIDAGKLTLTVSPDSILQIAQQRPQKEHRLIQTFINLDDKEDYSSLLEDYGLV